MVLWAIINCSSLRVEILHRGNFCHVEAGKEGHGEHVDTLVGRREFVAHLYYYNVYQRWRQVEFDLAAVSPQCSPRTGATLLRLFRRPSGSQNFSITTYNRVAGRSGQCKNAPNTLRF